MLSPASASHAAQLPCCLLGCVTCRARLFPFQTLHLQLTRAWQETTVDFLSSLKPFSASSSRERSRDTKEPFFLQCPALVDSV